PLDSAAGLRFMDAYDGARFGGGGDDAVSRVRERLDGLERSLERGTEQ
ncbi:MAG: hypothetical protein JWR32_223, partial [Mycobacterium sp.]|nr:hypothetical protein [Mycobacterium sp.]